MTSTTFDMTLPEQLFSTSDSPAQGVSAVKALQIANNQGIPIYTVTKDNIASVLPNLQLDLDVIQDIQNAVNTGKQVTVSKTNITFNGWNGVGYIITDPLTGDGAYMISGGMAGAQIMLSDIITDCEKPYIERVIANVELTNDLLPGTFAPRGLGLALRAGTPIAKYLNTITLFEWLKLRLGGAVIDGVAYTSLETGVMVGYTYLATFVYVSVAYELGVALGSLVNAELTCDWR